MSEPVVITWLRHGQVEGPAHVLRGRSEEPLSAEGRTQLQGALAELGARGEAFSRIVTSPRRRCAEFAREFALVRGREAEGLEDLAELDFGHWEGLDPRRLPATEAALYARLRQDPDSVTPPGGESGAQFTARVRRAVEMLAQGPGPVLAFTHAGVMRAVLADALGLTTEASQRVALAPAAWMRISYLAGAAPVLLELRSQC